MERLMKGDLVVVSFPFSNYKEVKKRPALVAATLKGNDVILCQITSEPYHDHYSIVLRDNELKQGRLKWNSLILADKLFTTEKTRIDYKIGSLKEHKIKEVEKEIIKIFRNN